jgi:hypothetical protein
VVLDYGHVYVDGEDLPEGKLVRVVGTLRLGKVKASRPGHRALRFRAFTAGASLAGKVVDRA